MGGEDGIRQLITTSLLFPGLGSFSVTGWVGEGKTWPFRHTMYLDGKSKSCKIGNSPQDILFRVSLQILLFVLFPEYSLGFLA